MISPSAGLDEGDGMCLAQTSTSACDEDAAGVWKGHSCGIEVGGWRMLDCGCECEAEVGGNALVFVCHLCFQNGNDPLKEEKRSTQFV